MTIRISVVIPAHNEAENLPPLAERTAAVLREMGTEFEILVVNDGSTDDTSERIRETGTLVPELREIRLREKSGQTAALLAGFSQARGEIVVTMDGDQQNDPADIPKLLEALDAADAAAGWRVSRKDPWLTVAASRIANAVRNRLSGDSIRDTGCGLKAFRRETLSSIPAFNGMHRFFPTLIRQAGYKVVEVPVSHRPRAHGQTHHSIRSRAIRAFVDLLAVRWMKSRRIRYEIEEK
ncbi:MAG: glycosyltransferase family 2 protein [Nitrospirae bacterium]|nr:glycosyltransferase family 2 protein [Nitrospirota bacterium]